VCAGTWCNRTSARWWRGPATSPHPHPQSWRHLFTLSPSQTSLASQVSHPTGPTFKFNPDPTIFADPGCLSRLWNFHPKSVRCIQVVLTQKNVTKLPEVCSDIFIPDPGAKKIHLIPEPRTGSTTLDPAFQFISDVSPDPDLCVYFCRVSEL
jgi:hypothetical protein